MNALLDYGSDDTEDETANDVQGEEIAENQAPSHEPGTLDFFNLATRVEVDEQEPKNKELKRKLTTSSGLTVEVPSDEFWAPVSGDDVKFVTEKGKTLHDVGRGSETTRNNKIRKDQIDFGCKTHKLKHSTSPYKSDSLQLVSPVPDREKSRNVRSVSSFGISEQIETNSIPGRGKSSSGWNNGDSYNPISNRKLFFQHSKIKPHLNGKSVHRIPNIREKYVTGHSGPVNRVKWNITIYSHLLMSISMDGSVKVWNFWSSLDPCVKTLDVHTKAVKDACWSHSGKEIISCGYDKQAILSDVDTGQRLTTFQHDNYVNCVKCHPDHTNIFVSGSYNILQSWDRRTPDRPIREFIYKDNTGQVQDVIFSADGNCLFSSCDLLSRDSADRNVMAWDFSSGVVLSNQIYQERYSCTRLKLHPTEGHFLAQTNGDYIAIFSTHKPYKLNKTKRFQGHKGNGYAVGFDLSVDGSLVVSGSADGDIYFYNYHTGRLLRTLTTGLDICTDVAIHPVLNSTVACCGWNGHVQVWR